MDSFGVWHWTILLLVLVLTFVPFMWVLASSRSHGVAKFGWFALVFFFSWLGLIAFLIATQSSRNRA
jgi:uncharacterized membrane protein YhaH (DUF805 family)